MSSISECDRPAMDSSAISSFGSAAMARASSSLRISTCVRSRGICLAFFASPTISSSSWQRASRSLCGVQHALARVHGVEQGNAQVVGERHAVERARQLEAARDAAMGALVGGQAVDRRGRRRCTLPVSFCNVPQMQLTSVLLPEPFGPIRPSRSPGCTSSVDAVERDEAAEALADIVDMQQRGHGLPPRASVPAPARPARWAR